jgi:hypothetical protein
MDIVILCVCAPVLGGWLGNYLAMKGVTPENALTQHQSKLYLILLTILGLTTPVFLAAYFDFSHWIPEVIVLYGVEYIKPVIGALWGFVITFYIFLEWKGRARHRYWLGRTMAVCGVLLMPLLWLIHELLPVTSLVSATKIRGGVVLQTTPYTCAPASIATLVRYVRPGSMISEEDVSAIAKTNRAGTSTLAEIRTLQALRFSPKFERNLTLRALMERQTPALLHVREPDATGIIRHTVALLKADPQTGTFLIANPLYGPQLKTADDMKDYWLKEAVFIH